MKKDFLPWIFRRSIWLLFLKNGPIWILCLRRAIVLSQGSRGKVLNTFVYSLSFQPRLCVETAGSIELHRRLKLNEKENHICMERVNGSAYALCVLLLQ